MGSQASKIILPWILHRGQVMNRTKSVSMLYFRFAALCRFVYWRLPDKLNLYTQNLSTNKMKGTITFRALSLRYYYIALVWHRFFNRRVSVCSVVSVVEESLAFVQHRNVKGRLCHLEIQVCSLYMISVETSAPLYGMFYAAWLVTWGWWFVISYNKTLLWKNIRDLAILKVTYNSPDFIKTFRRRIDYSPRHNSPHIDRKWGVTYTPWTRSAHDNFLYQSAVCKPAQLAKT